MHLQFVKRNDFNLVVGEPLPKLHDSYNAMASAQNTRGFMRVDRRQDATFIAVDDVLEGLLFRFSKRTAIRAELSTTILTRYDRP
jgi:hypothetical protein